MKIYHGSIEKVENPEIRESNRTLDYGRGFYTTTSYEQAESWVRRRMGEKKVALGYVCVYEFDETALQDLNVLIFETPTDEWVDFVMKNRIQDKKTLISELKTYKLVDQYLFHTAEALQYMKFIEAKEVIL